MDRTLPLFIIGLTFGVGIGFAIAAGNGITFDGHDHGDLAQHDDETIDHSAVGHGTGDHAMMHDTTLEVPSAEAPKLNIMVMRDPMTGYNLHVMAENFKFSPQNASLEHIAGEGHAHVYVNGVKRARLYGNWMHLDALPIGEVIVDVTLNSNDHRPLAVGGTNITASATLIVAE
jgi:hypothetical protein